ncbi:MAG TPA: flagellar FlbD family protein [Desulfuromonadaceae bacterium]
MILLTRMDRQQMYLNPDHIVSVEETPDTVITLFNGHHFIIRERAEVVISRIVAFRARVIRRASAPAGKKYLAKPKRSLFSGVMHDRKELSPPSGGEQFRTPLHTRDI